MIIRNGITSFFNSKRIPEFGFAEFKQIVSTSTSPIGFTILGFSERGVTPNFHSASLTSSTEKLTMLGHSTYPIVAFAEPLMPGSCELRFRDVDRIAQRVVDIYKHVTVASAEELSRKIGKLELEQLNHAELQQIKYWKPQTIGELVFNWWD